jgi:hypothetical protein
MQKAYFSCSGWELRLDRDGGAVDNPEHQQAVMNTMRDRLSDGSGPDTPTLARSFYREPAHERDDHS